MIPAKANLSGLKREGSSALQKIVPIILAGGVGTRLWPLSRKSYPKQFRKISDAPSLFQQTAQRFQGPLFQRPVVVTHDDYRFHVVEQMGEIGGLPELILLEPFSRNTAPAVLAAVLALAKKDPDAICLVTPSDHFLPDTDAFAKAVERGLEAVRAGRMITFGITPDRAETGYGYLELEGSHSGDNAVPLRSFKEKPGLEAAAQMLASGRHLWNAGIFLFRCADILAAFQAHAPEMLEPARTALEQHKRDLGFTRLSEQAWATLPDISIDYAVMEHANNLSVVPYAGRWSDLGSWQGVWREESKTSPTGDGVVTIGNAHAVDCAGSLLFADDTGQALVGLGLQNLVAVAMKDAVLVADRSRADQVGALVEHLKSNGISQAATLPRDNRPWGWFESLVSGTGFQVKLITVHPGGVLSLQSHEHRAEHWIVVEGSASVTIGSDTFTLAANQSAYVPQGEVHRLENTGHTDAVLVEVQTGPYLGEDDITRYEDAYARG